MKNFPLEFQNILFLPLPITEYFLTLQFPLYIFFNYLDVRKRFVMYTLFKSWSDLRSKTCVTLIHDLIYCSICVGQTEVKFSSFHKVKQMSEVMWCLTMICATLLWPVFHMHVLYTHKNA